MFNKPLTYMCNENILLGLGFLFGFIVKMPNNIKDCLDDPLDYIWDCTLAGMLYGIFIKYGVIFLLPFWFIPFITTLFAASVCFAVYKKIKS